MRLSPQVVELLAVFGALGLIVFVPMKQAILGAVLAVLGAFFPSRFSEKLVGTGRIKLGPAEASFSGVVRAGVVGAGLLLLAAAAVETVQSASRPPSAVIDRLERTQDPALVPWLAYKVVNDEALRRTYLTRQRMRDNPPLYHEVYKLICPRTNGESKSSTSLSLSTADCKAFGEALFAES
jgi:hypothetical protein